MGTLTSDFTIVSPDAPEAEYGKYPSRLTIQNAIAKANAVGDDNAVIIAADTVVFMRGRYYLKPKSEADAFDMLKTLSGKTHFVYTGVAIKCGGKITAFYEKSAVTFKNVSDKEISDYIAHDKPCDKAGAYGIQDNVVVKSYKGSYSNIMGFPLEKISKALRTLDVL